MSSGAISSNLWLFFKTQRREWRGIWKVFPLPSSYVTTSSCGSDEILPFVIVDKTAVRLVTKPKQTFREAFQVFYARRRLSRNEFNNLGGCLWCSGLGLLSLEIGVGSWNSFRRFCDGCVGWICGEVKSLITEFLNCFTDNFLWHQVLECMSVDFDELWVWNLKCRTSQGQLETTV